VSWLEPLLRALDDADAPARVFFRDSDAGWADERLLALLDLTGRHGVPVDVGIIPRELSPGLAAGLLERAARSPGRIGFHQHGFDHLNRGSPEQPAELCEGMPREQMLRMIGMGMRRLRGQLGLACDPIFSPPWGRCTPEAAECLMELGFLAVSGHAPLIPLGVPGLIELPTTVSWFGRGPGETRGLEALGLRLADAVTAGAPVGVMLHHELMDRCQLEAAGELFALLAEHDRSSCVRMWSIVESVRAGDGARGRLLVVCQGDGDRSGPRELGGGDGLLNADGREQSRAIVAALARERIDAVYTSALPRAVETILPLALERSLDLTRDEDLRERRSGDPDSTGELLEDADLDESLADLSDRALRFLGRVAPELQAGRTVVAVSHRTLVQMVLLLLDGRPYPVGGGAVFDVSCVVGDDAVPRAASVRPLIAAPAGMSMRRG